MLTMLADAIEQLVEISQLNFPLVSKILILLILIQIANWAVGYRLNVLGIFPRRIFGLFGIICAPFLHGNFNHLFYNMVPMFFLLTFLLYYGLGYFIDITVLIFLIGGGLTWFFARPGIHIGASSVVMGYFASLLIDAYQHPGLITILIALLTFYYLGGLFFNLLPGGKGVSWEGHVFGFIAGIAAVVII